MTPEIWVAAVVVILVLGLMLVALWREPTAPPWLSREEIAALVSDHATRIFHEQARSAHWITSGRAADALTGALLEERRRNGELWTEALAEERRQAETRFVAQGELVPRIADYCRRSLAGDPEETRELRAHVLAAVRAAWPHLDAPPGARGTRAPDTAELARAAKAADVALRHAAQVAARTRRPRGKAGKRR